MLKINDELERTLDLTERLIRDHRPGTEITKRPNEV